MYNTLLFFSYFRYTLAPISTILTRQNRHPQHQYHFHISSSKTIFYHLENSASCYNCFLIQFYSTFDDFFSVIHSFPSFFPRLFANNLLLLKKSFFFRHLQKPLYFFSQYIFDIHVQLQKKQKIYIAFSGFFFLFQLFKTIYRI